MGAEKPFDLSTQQEIHNTISAILHPVSCITVLNRLPRQPNCHPCLTHRWVTEGLFFSNRTITQQRSWGKGGFKLDKGRECLCV